MYVHYVFTVVLNQFYHKWLPMFLAGTLLNKAISYSRSSLTSLQILVKHNMFK